MGEGSRFGFALKFPITQPSAVVRVLSEAPVRERFEGMRVLLVDDNTVNIKVGKRLLEKMDCEVTSAVHRQQAVDAWKEGNFDLILMDCQMPIIDGFQATRSIRRARARARARRRARDHHRIDGERLGIGPAAVH